MDVKYHVQQYNGTFLHENIYRQDAGPEVDEAWEALGTDCEFSDQFTEKPMVVNKIKTDPLGFLPRPRKRQVSLMIKSRSTINTAADIPPIWRGCTICTVW